jgi:predicted deacetylase
MVEWLMLMVVSANTFLDEMQGWHMNMLLPFPNLNESRKAEQREKFLEWLK